MNAFLTFVGFIVFCSAIVAARFFFVKANGEKNKGLALTQELQQARANLAHAAQELEKYTSIRDLQEEESRLRQELRYVEDVLQSQRSLMAEYELKLDLEETSYYQPKFDLKNALEYAEALDLVREAEKELIAKKEVFLNDDESKNRELGKLALSAFNGDASSVIEAVTYSNFEKSKEKLRIAFNKVNNLLLDTGLQISSSYLELKLKEMALVYDLRESEQKIKEEQIELKEQMREEEQARVEAERAREKAIQEQERYQAALEEARQQEMSSRNEAERQALEHRVAELQRKLQEATEERERATSMAQITRKGHVYVISNVGAFGEHVYKIGMTRRKEPKDRIIELGDASVPFGFDIHALILADDAPALEALLHREFEAKRINKVNLRKEFFRVNIDHIANTCEKLGCKIEFTMLAEAREYRETLAKESATA